MLRVAQDVLDIDNWTDKIQRANLDGSNLEDLVTQGLRLVPDVCPRHPAQTAPHSPGGREPGWRYQHSGSNSCCTAVGENGACRLAVDVNGDGVASILDLILIAQGIG